MFNISTYLEKFKNIGLKELLLKEKIVKVVNEYTKAGIATKDVDIKNGIVNVKTDSLAKSELFMKKKKILDVLNEGERVPLKDIR